MTTRLIRLLTVLLGFARVVEGQRPNGWAGTVDAVGDTITVTTTLAPSAGWPPIVSADSVIVLWRSDSIERPTAIAVGSNGRLYVADRQQIFLLDSDGHLLSTLGRRGRGPGEFRSIDGLAAVGDTLLVWDGAELRLTWLRSDGTVVRTRSVAAPRGYQSARRIVLQPLAVGVILAWSAGLVRPMAPPDSVALAFVKWSGDSAIVLATTPDIAWVDGGMMLGPRYPFGQRPLFTVGTGGRYAWADGVDYCIALGRVGERPVQRVCRRWERQRVGTANVPPADTAGIGRVGPAFAAIAAKQEFGREKNSIDDIRFDANGQLWVRVVDASHHYHPMYVDRLSQLRPAHYLWEVFDIDGKLNGRVALPGRFKPLTFLSRYVLGLLEDDDGTLSIARVEFPRLR